MIWTTQHPTSPGWYWLRLPQANSGNGEAVHGIVIVEVFDTGYGSLYYLWGEGRWDVSREEGVKWAGPLPLPEEESLNWASNPADILRDMGAEVSPAMREVFNEDTPPTVDREAWLNGWSRMGTSVLVGTGVHCAGCGKFNGIACVAFGPDYVAPEKEPDWPFNEADCPLCMWRENPPAPRDLLAERAERLAKTRGDKS